MVFRATLFVQKCSLRRVTDKPCQTEAAINYSEKTVTLSSVFKCKTATKLCGTKEHRSII